MWRTHLEKVKERDVFDQRPVEALVVFEEEEVGEGSVDAVGVGSGQFDQLQALLPTVPAPPEGRGVLLRPGGPRVGLHRQHVQTHSVHWREHMPLSQHLSLCD